MELDLQGKNAIITGGSAGIGFGCARALVREGVHVAIVARHADRLAEAAAALHEAGRVRPEGAPRVVAIVADLSRAEDVERAAREATAAFGRIDILVNNAGAAIGGNFLELADEAYVGAWTLKTLGYIRMTRAIAPQMIERRDGRIVNIIGGAARSPSPTFLSGSAANAAVLNFTRGVSRELAQHNVRINAISPGNTATERGERLIAQDAKLTGRSIEEVRAERVQRIPLHRITHPDEIGALVALLVSDRVPSMTGGEVVIDGGAQPGV